MGLAICTKRSQDTKCGFHIPNSKRDLLQVLYPKRTKFRKYEKGKWKGRKKRLSHMSRFSHMSLNKVIRVSNKNIRDQKLRKLAAKYELKRMLYKAICQDRTLSGRVRNKTLKKLSKLPRNSSFTRVRNRCIFTGRSRSVYQLFRMSRIVFRELASKGSLIGINKSCW